MALGVGLDFMLAIGAGLNARGVVAIVLAPVVTSVVAPPLRRRTTIRIAQMTTEIENERHYDAAQPVAQ
ncbi:hypothetical protein [Micromonospora sediminicola]|uniref:hypothetical protein n=1 Tax=Micromonospora sediminicola TaxID=946078 RepID=UPI0037B7CEC0